MQILHFLHGSSSSSSVEVAIAETAAVVVVVLVLVLAVVVVGIVVVVVVVVVLVIVGGKNVVFVVVMVVAVVVVAFAMTGPVCKVCCGCGSLPAAIPLRLMLSLMPPTLARCPRFCVVEWRGFCAGKDDEEENEGG